LTSAAPNIGSHRPKRKRIGYNFAPPFGCDKPQLPALQGVSLSLKRRVSNYCINLAKRRQNVQAIPTVQFAIANYYLFKTHITPPKFSTVVTLRRSLQILHPLHFFPNYSPACFVNMRLHPSVEPAINYFIAILNSILPHHSLAFFHSQPVF
jgi:hypothetical protein